ncbi:MAG: LysM peptidoglycan-binding domain-containing protein [Phaeodactylibacter sp.]|nr:LysM peptidoglycan-binding domain-containing protein [Phaeodactylibacter sp.]MCB9274787.1 LysM peptidoglycan-binding domain-containing protein [Lewinellaceae bacterium]
MNKVKYVVCAVLIWSAFAQAAAQNKLVINVVSQYTDQSTWNYIGNFNIYKPLGPGTDVEAPYNLILDKQSKKIQLSFTFQLDGQVFDPARVILRLYTKDFTGNTRLDYDLSNPESPLVVEYGTRNILEYSQLWVQVFFPAIFSRRFEYTNQTAIIPFVWSATPRSVPLSKTDINVNPYTQSGFYAVQLASGTKKDENDIRMYQEVARQSGQDGLFVYTVTQGGSYPVKYRVGAFESRDKAEGFIRFLNKYPRIRNNGPRVELEQETIYSAASRNDFAAASSRALVPLSLDLMKEPDAYSTTGAMSSKGEPALSQGSIPASNVLYAIQLYAVSAPPTSSVFNLRGETGSPIAYFEKRDEKYYVRVGLYTSLYEATQALNRIKNRYPQAFIIEERGAFANADMHPNTILGQAQQTPAATSTYPATRKLTHTVKEGETLYGIARMYEVTAEDIRQLNNLGPYEVILAGQTLRIR